MTRACAIIVCFLLLTGCKKNPLPEPSVEVPDFYLDCKLDQQPLLLEAGNSEYYMNTSCYKDSSEVYVFKGNLSQPCTGTCGYGFTLLINDFKLSTSGAPDINSALHVGSYSYNDNVLTSDIYNVQLAPEEKQIASNSYTWEVTGANTPKNIQPGYYFGSKFKAGETYTVTLFMETSSGCLTDHTRIFTVGATQGNIRAKLLSSTALTYSFTSDIKDEAGNRYLWS